MKYIIPLLAFISFNQLFAQVTTIEKKSLPLPLHVTVINYPNLEAVLRFKKLELGIQLPKAILNSVNSYLFNEGLTKDELNPFVEWDIDIQAIFTHTETKNTKAITAYYHREYRENESTNDWDDIGTDFPFRIRFAPPQNGKWEAIVTMKVKNEIRYRSSPIEFNVTESGDPGYVYVHPNKKNLMRGNKMIFPVGHNFSSPYAHDIAWGGNENYLGKNLFDHSYPTKAANTLEWEYYRATIEDYFSKGGRFIRTMQTPWSSLIEFEKKGNYYDRLHYAWEQDKLLDLCEQYDALVQFNMLIHQPFTIGCVYGIRTFDWGNHNIINDTLQFDPNDQYPAYCYNDNPAKIDGKQPHEAISNDEDLKYHQQRTRYYIARYGYSTNIYSFELLSEPFNVGVSKVVGQEANPYMENGSTLQKIHFEAIEKYQGSLAWYIKEYMNHTEHLLGVDYAMFWKNERPLFFDQSLYHDNIDIIGINFYSFYQNKYLVGKPNSKDNNAYENDENSVAKAFYEIQKWTNKPIIISESGDSDGINACSNYSGHYIDVMSMGFTNVCGFNLWEGFTENQQFIWPSTINAQKHMNSEEVLETLGDERGQWIQGRQTEKLHLIGDKANAKELQYYISQSKEKAVGYVRNLSYNAHTNRINNENCNLTAKESPLIYGNTSIVKNFQKTPINKLTDITWNQGPKSKRLKVQGLKKNTEYEIDWYTFKEGTSIGRDCQKTTGTDLILHFPELKVTSTQNQRPLIWFVIRKMNCPKK